MAFALHNGKVLLKCWKPINGDCYCDQVPIPLIDCLSDVTWAAQTGAATVDAADDLSYLSISSGTGNADSGKYQYLGYYKLDFGLGYFPSELFRSDDFGATFTSLGTNAFVPAVSKTGQYVVYAVGDDAATHGLMYSSDYGVSFSATTNPTLKFVGFGYQLIFPMPLRSKMLSISDDGQKIFAIGVNDAFEFGDPDEYRYSHDAGATWNSTVSPIITPGATQFSRVQASDDGQYVWLYDISEAGTYFVWRSDDYGVTFTGVVNLSLFDPAVSSTGQYVVMRIQGGGTAISDDYGVSFTNKPDMDTIVGTDYTIRSVSADGQAIVAGDSDRFWLSVDGAESWCDKTTTVTEQSLTVSGGNVALSAYKNVLMGVLSDGVNNQVHKGAIS